MCRWSVWFLICADNRHFQCAIKVNFLGQYLIDHMYRYFVETLEYAQGKRRRGKVTRSATSSYRTLSRRCTIYNIPSLQRSMCVYFWRWGAFALREIMYRGIMCVRMYTADKDSATGSSIICVCRCAFPLFIGDSCLYIRGSYINSVFNRDGWRFIDCGREIVELYILISKFDIFILSAVWSIHII